jgi:YHS domain-containing protein
MVRVVLVIILIIFIARAFWRIVDNIVEAATGRPLRGRSGPWEGSRHGASVRSAKMVRDPVCGTFVLPERAVSIADGRGRAYFCSETCRDKYRARTA